MANRSYLYSHHPGEPPEYRDFAEWNYEAPIAHFLLVGVEPTICKSAIWNIDEKIAIKGDAIRSRPVFSAFLNWLRPQLKSSSFDAAVAQSNELLTRADRQGSQFHLELGEIYELSGLDAHEMESATVSNAQLAGEVFAEVRDVISTAGTTLRDFRHPKLKQLTRDWESQLGLYFSGILYFNLG